MKKILFYSFLLIFFAGCEKTELNEISDLNQNEELKSSSVDVINVPGDYSTIQEAINHATNGTTIYVTGTYKEFIRIENLTDIKLIGKYAVIKQPDVDYYNVFVVFKNCKNFQFKGFTIDGDDSNMTSYDPTKSYGFNAITCKNSSGKIENNTFKNMVAHWRPGGDGNVILISSNDYNQSIFIINNKISNFFFLGIASWGNSFLHIEGNEIVCSTENKYTKGSCINPMGGRAVIKNNTI